VGCGRHADQPIAGELARPAQWAKRLFFAGTGGSGADQLRGTDKKLRLPPLADPAVAARLGIANATEAVQEGFIRLGGQSMAHNNELCLPKATPET
jgi:hypothetical protein